VVHAPRQTGKTTALGALARDLAAEGRQAGSYGQSLLSVLAQMRDGFRKRPFAFPASVALCGLRDVRGLPGF
jgi:hypothetical protein